MAAPPASMASAALLPSFSSIRCCSSSTSSTIPSVPLPNHSTRTQKSSSLPSKKPSLADQLQPLSKEYLDAPPPPARTWNAPSRRKARDSQPRTFPIVDQWSPGISAVKEAMTLLEEAEESEEGVAAALEEKVSNLSARDIVAIINGERSWRRALLFFNWLKANGSFQLNIYVYNVLLKTLRRAEQWEIARGVAEKMAEDGIIPDNITYSTLISFAIRCRQPEEALKWFQRMRESGCTPDAVTYSAMIDVYAKTGRMDEAADLCLRMQKDGLPRDAVAYSTMIKLHGMQGNFEEMMDVYEEMQFKKVVPNVVTFNSMISVLGNAGKTQQVMRLFHDMLSSGLKPSPVTLSLLFRTYAKARNAEEAFELYRTIKKEGWTVDTVVYNTLLSLCVQLGKIEEGELFHQELLEDKKCRPDDWTWRTMADLYVRAGRLEEGRQLASEMLQRGRTPDIPIYMSLIQGYGRKKEMKTVVELVDEMQAGKIPLDHRLSGALLAVLVLCEEEGVASMILDRIELAHPRLRMVVDILTKEDFNAEEDVKEAIRAMLSGTSEDCRRPFCNMLMDLCWNRNMGQRAHHILALAVSFGVYSDLQSRSPSEWCLKLRTLSFGAARTALEGWFSSLHAALQQGQELPPLLSIEVGVGILFTPDNTVLVMSIFVLTQLKTMRAPFEETRTGLLTASEEAVKAWLQSRESPFQDSPHQNALASVQT